MHVAVLAIVGEKEEARCLLVSYSRVYYSGFPAPDRFTYASSLTSLFLPLSLLFKKDTT